MRRSRILLIPTGGTIDTVRDARGLGVDSGLDARGQARTMLDLVPGIREAFEVSVSETALARGDPLTVTALLELAQTIAAADVDGCVVTHGTDMLEETAYYLSLVMPSGRPVVVTGSMRPPGDPGSDAGANLMAAMIVAATPAVGRHAPVVVVFHDLIHIPRWVAKTNASLLGAFTSPDAGPVGAVVEGQVVLFWRDKAESDLLGLPDRATHRVDVVWTYLGADALLVDAAAAVADGLVIAGAGGGHVSPDVAESLIRVVRQGKPVVLASRHGGPTLESTYAGPGCEVELLAAGLLPAGGLSPVKARLRLLVALDLGLEPARAFAPRVPQYPSALRRPDSVRSARLVV